MGKKNRVKKNKKPKAVKTREERENDIRNAKLQLSMLGLDESIPGIKKAYGIFQRFIDEGLYDTGKIPLIGYQRVLKYMLLVKPGCESVVMLEYNQSV